MQDEAWGGGRGGPQPGGTPQKPACSYGGLCYSGEGRWDESEPASWGRSWVPASRSFSSNRLHLDLGAGGCGLGPAGGRGAAGSGNGQLWSGGLGISSILRDALEAGETAGPPQTQTGALCVFLVWQVNPGWNFCPFEKKKIVICFSAVLVSYFLPKPVSWDTPLR